MVLMLNLEMATIAGTYGFLPIMMYDVVSSASHKDIKWPP